MITVLPRAETMKVIDAKALMGDSEPPATDPQTGMPGPLKAYIVHTDPKVIVIPHFFSEAECDHLVQMVDQCWMPSLVRDGSSPSGQEKSIEKSEDTNLNRVSHTRTSWSCMLRAVQTSVVERLEHRCASIAGLPVEQMERMNMVRYAPGEFFNEHHDGKFRPKTIFVYLNDLADEDDECGDTFFPVLGLSFKPRKGTAVMWLNTETGETEDSRMVHAGRCPNKGVKYGVNCFFNESCVRRVLQQNEQRAWAQAVVSKVSSLAGPPVLNADGVHQPIPYMVVKDPQVKAVPGFLAAAEVEHILEEVRANGSSRFQLSGPFREGAQTLHHLEFAITPTVAVIEARMAAVTGDELGNLAKLRVVHPGTKEGLCNRGCGRTSMYVCINGEDEVFFPGLGIRFQLSPGDALAWTNVNFDTGEGREDLRTLRVHWPEGGAESVIGIDAHFHDHPLRAQQQVRSFVGDAIAKKS